MQTVKVKFHPADKEYFFLPEFTEKPEAKAQLKDQVIVETVLGRDIGTIYGFVENHDNNIEIKPMLRPANKEDLTLVKSLQAKSSRYSKKFKELCLKHNLKEIKAIDAVESFDSERLTFYFTSNTRVDFRELVKDLVKSYHKKIRLQQIGVRDAARFSGGVGSCGLCLCCGNWLSTLGGVSPDFIKDQDLMHRGADRLSGPCGRLKCCLRYEEETYRYNLDKLPKVGEIIKTRVGEGRVVAVQPLKQTVNLEIDGTIVEYPYLEGKQCQPQESNHIKSSSS